MNESVNMALDSIVKHKLRSFLTVLGIVIGVATVIGMSSIVSGLNSSIANQIASIGSNLVFVARFSPALGRPSPEIFNRPKLKIEDAEAIAAVPNVEAVAPLLRMPSFAVNAGSYAVRYRENHAKNSIYEGVTPQHDRVFNLSLSGGRWITETDNAHRANVAVLGYDTAQTLFPMLDPLGKEVEVAGKLFTVVGVLDKRPDALTPGSNPADNVVEMPIETFRKMWPRQDDMGIGIKIASQEAIPRALEQVEETMRRRRGLSADKPNNFGIFTQDSFTDLWNQISGGIFVVMLAISSVALLVGGVGVMNIMLVSVTERTREIGVRKAIGARRHDIMMQFVFEAMTLTGVGGVLGILIGALVTLAIRAAVPFLPASMSAFWVITGFSSSVGIGLVFGIYPAYKASVLSPIEALRYE